MKLIRICIEIIHFIFCKFYYLRSFKTRGLSLFSFRSKIIIKSGGKIELQGRVVLGDFCELRALGKIKMGKDVFVNKYSRIISHESVEIGNNVLIAQFVSILDHDHRYYYQNDQIQFDGYTTEPVKIGNNVLIGDKVTILKGTVIGDNVIIGAHALVKGVIPANSRVHSPLASANLSHLNGDLI